MGRGADLAWNRLPDYMVAADTGDLTSYLGSIADQMNPSLDILTAADPNTSVSGACEIADPARAPRGSGTSGNWLNWLGWLVGIDTAAIADADVRAAVADASATQRRGSIGAITTAVKRTLTGSKTVWVYSNVSGVDPYLITVIVLTAEAASVPATLAAAWTEKPAGADLEVLAVAGTSWTQAVAEYGDWTDVVAAKANWTALINAIP